MYRAAIAARRLHFVHDEAFEWIDLGTDVLAFRRGSGAICVVNLGGEQVELPDGGVLVASTDVSDGLPPDAAVWILPA